MVRNIPNGPRGRPMIIRKFAIFMFITSELYLLANLYHINTTLNSLHAKIASPDAARPNFVCQDVVYPNHPNVAYPDVVCRIVAFPEAKGAKVRPAKPKVGVDVNAPGVGILLHMGYGELAFKYANETTIRFVRIEGSDEYKQVMKSLIIQRRGTVEDWIESSKPEFPRCPSYAQEIVSMWFGKDEEAQAVIHKNTQILANMVKDLRKKAWNKVPAMREKLPGAVIAVPGGLRVAGCMVEEIFNQAGLKDLWAEKHYDPKVEYPVLYETAAFRGGLYLDPSGDNGDPMWNNTAPPIRTIVRVHFSATAVSATMIEMTSPMAPSRLRNAMIDPELGNLAFLPPYKPMDSLIRHLLLQFLYSQEKQQGRWEVWVTGDAPEMRKWNDDWEWTVERLVCNVIWEWAWSWDRGDRDIYMSFCRFVNNPQSAMVGAVHIAERILHPQKGAADPGEV